MLVSCSCCRPFEYTRRHWHCHSCKRKKNNFFWKKNSAMTTTYKHTKSGVTSDTSPYRLTPHRTIRSQSDISNYIEFYYLHETSTALSRPRTRRTSYIVTIRMGGTIRVTTGFCFFAVGKVVNFSPESIFSSSHATHYGHAYARMSTEILRTRVLLRNYIFLSR